MQASGCTLTLLQETGSPLFGVSLTSSASTEDSQPFHHQEIQIMKLEQFARNLIIMVALVAAISACQKPEGPAERAGKAIDNATEQAGSQIEEVGKNIQDAAKGAKK